MNWTVCPSIHQSFYLSVCLSMYIGQNKRYSFIFTYEITVVVCETKQTKPNRALMYYLYYELYCTSTHNLCVCTVLTLLLLFLTCHSHRFTISDFFVCRYHIMTDSRFDLVLSRLVLSCLVLSCLVLSCLIFDYCPPVPL